jgi:hypothetical protein
MQLTSPIDILFFVGARMNKNTTHSFRLGDVKHFFIKLLGFAILAAVFDVIIINAFFFPDCNRDTNQCFVVHHLWGAQ